MKKNTMYTLRLVLANDSADIEYAQCGCAAGRGPTGSCKHIAAMCYALEDFYRVHLLPEHVPSTSRLQTWNQPRKRCLDSAASSDIKFVKMEYGKIKRSLKVTPYDPRPAHLRRTSDEEVKSLRQTLEIKGNVALLHVLPTTGNVTSSVHVQRLPLIPRSSIERIQHQVKKSTQPLSLGDIFSFSKQLVDRLTLAPEDIHAVEKATRKQHDSRRWHEERYGRLTSSAFGDIVKCRLYEGHAVRKIYPTHSNLSTSAIQWGRSKESVARQQYEQALKQQSPEMSVQQCGVYISNDGFLAASPDGIICNEEGSPVGTLEIKCPYTQRNKTIVDACKKSNFPCEAEEDSVHLKTNHDYYYQVQGQLAILNLTWCDFVVWTVRDMHIERIYFNEKFWKERCYPKLFSFYYGIILPELVYPRHTLALNIFDYRPYM